MIKLISPEFISSWDYLAKRRVSIGLISFFTGLAISIAASVLSMLNFPIQLWLSSGFIGFLLLIIGSYLLKMVVPAG